jgi:CBS-domain-containing membrane protein
MKIRDVMTQPAISVPVDASVLQAGELMVRHDISGLPVTDAKGHLVGIVTERDFLRPAGVSTGFRRPRWLEVITGQSIPPAEPERFRERRVADVMTPEAVTVVEDTPLDEWFASWIPAASNGCQFCATGNWWASSVAAICCGCLCKAFG